MSPPSGGVFLRKKLRRRYRKLSDEKFNAAFSRSISRVEKGLRDRSIKGEDIYYYTSFYMEYETTYESISSFEYFLSKTESLKERGEPNTQPTINKKTLPSPEDRVGITNAIESIDDNGPIVIPKGWRVLIVDMVLVAFYLPMMLIMVHPKLILVMILLT